jgi:hypothetical protein
VIVADAPIQNTSNPYEDIGRPDGASEPNMQIFLNNFLCQANANGTGYFFFDVRFSFASLPGQDADRTRAQFFDEPWKDVQFGGVEGFWGLFYHKSVFCLLPRSLAHVHDFPAKPSRTLPSRTARFELEHRYRIFALCIYSDMDLDFFRTHHACATGHFSLWNI